MYRPYIISAAAKPPYGKVEKWDVRMHSDNRTEHEALEVFRADLEAAGYHIFFAEVVGREDAP